MPGVAAVPSKSRRGAWLRYALVFSLGLHLALAAWIYSVRSPVVLVEPLQRIFPVFIVPRRSPPPPPPPVPQEAGPPRQDLGGLSGQGRQEPSIPLREPERVVDPPPQTRNPDPEAPSMTSNAGSGEVRGDGAAATPGAGAGQGQGSGPGAGDGRGPGGRGGTPDGWKPVWRRLPTRDELDRFYPPRAKFNGISGGAILVCTVGVTGRVFNCRVAKEVPAGQGFGQAAVSLSRYFRIAPRRVNGRAVESELVIPYTMTLDAPTRDSGSLGTRLPSRPPDVEARK